MQIDWGETKLLSGPLHFFFSSFCLSWLSSAMDINKTSYKKRKEKKINEKKKWNPDRIQFTFKTQQSAIKHILYAKMKVQTLRNKAHTCLFFLIKKVKAHSPTFILFVKLCKKPISKKKKKNDISTFPPLRKLVLKSQQWHILYIVLSPLKLYWVLQGDQT